LAIGEIFDAVGRLAAQGGRKHGLTAMAAISAQASIGWRSAKMVVSLPPVASPRRRFALMSWGWVKHHALGPFMIRMDSDVDLLIQRRTSECEAEAIGAGTHRFATKSAARRKLPTHLKY
jgi:hypothetical protein